MIIHRTKNATRNIMFGTLLKIFQLVIPFVMRTIMIYFLGIQYLGLNSLFLSVLQVLNLAELGVGSAMVYSMYKPISEGDTITICALMNLYKKYYRIIGIVILCLGMLLYPFIPKLISGEIPEGINIHILYILNLVTTVLSYWLFGYKNCLLTAHQRSDLSCKVVIFTSTIQYLLQILCLVILKNYYLYLIVALCTQVANNVCISLVVDKQFPLYFAKGELEKSKIQDINKRIKALFTAKFSATILNSTDTVIISAFLGLTVLAIYNNYYFIMNSILGFVMIIYSASVAGIGNSLVTEKSLKIYKDFEKFTFIIMWVLCFTTTCLLVLYQPFMELWVEKEAMLPFSMVILFCIYFHTYALQLLFSTYKDAAGIWYTDRYRPLVSSLVKLGLNLLLIKYCNVYAIVISTIVSMIFVGMPWIIKNLFNQLFFKSCRFYVLQLFNYLIVNILIIYITYIITTSVLVGGIIGLCIKTVICIVVPNCLLFLRYYRRSEYQFLKRQIYLVLGRQN